MCGPAAAMLAPQVAGAISGAVGASMSASTQKMGLKLDAAIARINADKARDNAREVLREGYEMEVRQRTATGLVKGAQRAAMGANNVDMSTGSGLNRLTSTDYVGERDVQQIGLNAMREAAGYRTDALNSTMRANMDKAGARSINPLLTGATSLVGSASSIALNWYSMSRAGMLSSPTLSGGGGGNMFTPSPTSTMNYDAGGNSMRYGTIR